ncbi:ABC transporter substrate-binding protein [Thermodesulfovibrionales bacterium]|nr:ABC transporter substrate-binding protein [Thermodesulfovibrionales bacterium]MCL0049942.1 ABC transporter substrate-binding protein [Thermodesulfovibrionales bacterium]
MKTGFMSLVSVLALLMLVAEGVSAEEARMGAWVDEIVAVQEVSPAAAIARLKAGDIHIYVFGLTDPAIHRKIVGDPDLKYTQSFGWYTELSFNPVGPIFPGDGRLNPFAVPRMREAINWLIDRTYIAEEIFRGLAVPMYTALHPSFPDYARLAGVIRGVEIYYAHNPERARAVITEEMIKLGAELINEKWHYRGEPVELSILIRVEDERLRIGRHLAMMLEEMGFVVERLYRTAAEAAPIWIHGNPADGRFHIYTGAWIATAISRDQSGVFDLFYTPRGMSSPLWMAYKPSPEFDEVAGRLARRDFVSLEERSELFIRAIELSMRDSTRVWVANRVAFEPHRAEVEITSDLAGGISGSSLWALTARFVDRVGGRLVVAMPNILADPWSPIAGSNWIFDMMFIRATADDGLLPDPFTGLARPQRIESARVYIEEGLPVRKTHEWLDLKVVPEIEVPSDAWIGWCATAQRFITVGERYPEGLTARRKSVVYYPECLYQLKWHDGSYFSLADIVIGMILAFDRAKEESQIFDRAAVPAFEAFMKHFRGVRIVQESPLVIETYSDLYFLDAELNVSTWFPNYAQGPAPWHKLSLGILAEMNRELAFSSAKADYLGVEWMSYIAGPSMKILESRLREAIATAFIPYYPTMRKFVTAEEAVDRHKAMRDWHAEKGHFWVGSGPFYLQRAHPVERVVHLKRSPYFPDPAQEWMGFAEPWIAEVEVSGPRIITIGEDMEFEVKVTFRGNPYPIDGVDSVKYLVIDAIGDVAIVGNAEAVTDGLWRIMLTAEETAKLMIGSARLEVIVAPLLVSIPSSTALDLVAIP